MFIAGCADGLSRLSCHDGMVKVGQKPLPRLQRVMGLMVRGIDDAVAFARIATVHMRTNRLMAEENAITRLHGRIKIGDSTTRSHRRQYQRHQESSRYTNIDIQRMRHD